MVELTAIIPGGGVWAKHPMTAERTERKEDRSILVYAFCRGFNSIGEAPTNLPVITIHIFHHHARFVICKACSVRCTVRMLHKDDAQHSLARRVTDGVNLGKLRTRVPFRR